MARRELPFLLTACFLMAQNNRLSIETVGSSMIEWIVKCFPGLINGNIFLEPKIAHVKHGRPGAANGYDPENNVHLSSIQCRESGCLHTSDGEKMDVDI